MKCFIVQDKNWDNASLIFKVINKLDEETILNCFTTNNVEIISRACSKKMFKLIRHGVDNDIKTLYQTIINMDFLILFTDFIEYNNMSSIILEFCNLNNIPILIYTNYVDKKIFNKNTTPLSISKLINMHVDINYLNIKVPVFNEINIYLDNSVIKKIRSVEKMIINLRKNYKDIETSKKRIIVIN